MPLFGKVSKLGKGARFLRNLTIYPEKYVGRQIRELGNILIHGDDYMKDADKLKEPW
jgi:hypothetical protein